MSAGFIVRSAAIAVLVYGFIGGGASIAQAQVNPPSGSLSAAELDTIAADIREVIRDPLAPGADEKREALFQWIQASLDVDVIVCPNILGPVAQLKDHPYRAELVSLAVLAGAAHNIESPDQGIRLSKWPVSTG